MNIIGLVGPSGSGKSHSAGQVAERSNASMIIDDGLLIHRGKILAGFSAKFETNAVAAVRRAIFLDPTQRQSVMQQLATHKPQCILVLGTSEKMIRTICNNLKIDGDIEWLPIHTITTEEQLSLAGNLRKYGLHAIPIKESQVEESPSYKNLLQKITYKLLHRDAFIPITPTAGLTIVNPVFTGGAISVHPRVVEQSIQHLAEMRAYPFHIKRVQTTVKVLPCILVTVHADWCENLTQPAQSFVQDVRTYLQDTLGFPFANVQVKVASISPPGSLQPGKSRAQMAIRPTR